MPDSADDLLAYIRTCDRQYAADGTFSGNAVEAFRQLDALLSNGGSLPAAWVPGRQ